MNFNRRWRSNRAQGGSQNGQTSSNTQKSIRSGSRRTFNHKRSEFKFQLQDATRKGQYTCEKLTEAIVLKVQKEFEGGRYIASSLRNRVKKGPDLPTLQHSAKTNQAEKDREQKEFQSRYEAQMNHYCIANEKFENEWVKAYSLIYDQSESGSKFQRFHTRIYFT